MHKMLVAYGKFLHWCLRGHVFYLASPCFLFLHITSEWLTKHRCCRKVKIIILNRIPHFAVLLNRHLWESIKHSWEKWFFGRQADTSSYKHTCVQWSHQDNVKILKRYTHSLEKRKKKRHTSIKSVVYPKQLLPLSYISGPYWRTSDTLLTFRSINNYCSLWDAERGFREFTGKRHNLLAAAKQLQHTLLLQHPHLQQRPWLMFASWLPHSVTHTHQGIGRLLWFLSTASMAPAEVLNVSYLSLSNSYYSPAPSACNDFSFWMKYKGSTDKISSWQTNK